MSDRPDQESLTDTTEAEDRRVSIPVGQLRRWQVAMQAAAQTLHVEGYPQTAKHLVGIGGEMTGAEHAPGYVPGVQIDGDLIATAVGLVCTRVGMTEEAAGSIAEAAVVELAGVPGVTVLRGPDSAPWQPAPAGSAP